MRKYNKHKMAMYQKYGPGWDAPLFRSANSQVESGPPQAPPLILDDATEEKAEVYSNVIKEITIEEQRKRVVTAIRKLDEATDNDVARALGIHPSTVSARRNEARDRGEIVPVLDSEGKKKKKIDPITQTLNTLWKVNNNNGKNFTTLNYGVTDGT